jgi:hypothetical protein
MLWLMVSARGRGPPPSLLRTLAADWDVPAQPRQAKRESEGKGSWGILRRAAGDLRIRCRQEGRLWHFTSRHG